MANAVESGLKEFLSSPASHDEKRDRSGKIRMLSILCCAALIALVVAGFVRTLGSYFLADDFGEVAYVSKIWAGNWSMFWANWTGNYMQIPGMAVYRPMLLISLLLDYGMWHANAFGYYLTNVLYFAADTLLLFGVTRQLTTSWDSARSLICSFFAAALFATNPLHCESVSWVVGRVDTACCFYFLAGLLAFLQGRSTQGRAGKLWKAASVACFWLGILTKEMAIGLPVVVSAVAFLFPTSAAVNSKRFFAGLKERFFSALVETAPFWISTIAYFGVRYLTLGTLTGGYTGGIGEGQASSAISRWLDPYTYQRLLLPFAIGIFPANTELSQLLTFAYAGAVVLLALQIARRQVPWQNALFVMAWAGAAALPIYKLWGIGMNLEGARFCFFLTAPMCLALPYLLLSPGNGTAEEASDIQVSPLQSPPNTSPAGRIQGGRKQAPDATALLAVVSALLAVMVFVNFKVLAKTNAAWVHAGKEVRAFTGATTELAERIPAPKRILVLGIPKVHIGAHEIYNGYTLMTAVKQPFIKQPCDQRLETFDPIFFGPDQFINSARFKALIAGGKASAPFVWNSSKKRFVASELPSPHEPAVPMQMPLDVGTHEVQLYTDGHAGVENNATYLSFTNVQQGDGLRFSPLQLNPLSYDFLEFQYRLPKSFTDKTVTFSAKWNGTTIGDGLDDHCTATLKHTVAPQDLGQWRLARVPLSHFWRWYARSTVSELALLLPPVSGIDVKDIRLLSDSQLRPTLRVQGKQADGGGVCYQTKGASLFADASNIPGATSLQLESTRPNFFFDQIQADQLQSALFATKVENKPTAVVAIDKDMCTPSSYFEVRVRALDAHSKPLGEYSEPVILFYTP